MVAYHTHPTRDLACNPGMCSDWESNQQPFGFQAGTQSTEPHQPGPGYGVVVVVVVCFFLKILFIYFQRERGREGEREGEEHGLATSCMPPTGHLAHNPGTYPEWESNW